MSVIIYDSYYRGKKHLVLISDDLVQDRDKYGAKAEKITSMIGSAKFKECKSSTNCYITTDENFFGPNQLDKFDAVVFKPGHLRADKVLFFNLSPF